MEVYRISKCKYIEDLSGTGARIYGGRWNSKGQAVVYTASSRSLAALETMAHIPQKNFPSDFCIAIIQIPDTLKIQDIPDKKLPHGWQTIALRPSVQFLGDQWIKKSNAAVLRVPSVIIPEEYNLLINPLHPATEKVKIKEVYSFVFDKRLKK